MSIQTISILAKHGDFKDNEQAFREVLLYVGPDDKTRRYVGAIVLPAHLTTVFIEKLNS